MATNIASMIYDSIFDLDELSGHACQTELMGLPFILSLFIVIILYTNLLV